MASLNESIAKRISKLMRMFSSSFENERHIALAKLKFVLDEEGLTFSDIATVIENCNGEIEQLRYSDADAAAIYARGVEKGRAERPAYEPTEFFDADGEPCWYAIALFCRDNKAQLHRDWDKGFVEDMPGKIVSYGKPTANQARQLLRIFIMLGGIADPKVVQAFV